MTTAPDPDDPGPPPDTPPDHQPPTDPGDPAGPGPDPGGPSAGANAPAAIPSVPSVVPMTVSARLTWFRLHAATTVIDFPLHSPTATRAWVATMWPDTRIAGGWQRQFWQPGPAGRGFVPAVVELGDVLQFGIEHAPSPGAKHTDPPQVSLWHGYLHAVNNDSVLIHGPHPSPRHTLAAAQDALIQQIHHSAHTPTGPTTPGRSTHLNSAHPGAAITPAQPPTAVTVAFDGANATVGDPHHGWLVVPTDQLMTAMTRPPTDLTRLLTGRVHLTGREAPLTLAALTAHHAPEHLTAPPAAGHPHFTAGTTGFTAPAPSPGPAAPPPAAPQPAPSTPADPAGPAQQPDLDPSHPPTPFTTPPEASL